MVTTVMSPRAPRALERLWRPSPARRLMLIPYVTNLDIIDRRNRTFVLVIASAIGDNIIQA